EAVDALLRRRLPGALRVARAVALRARVRHARPLVAVLAGAARAGVARVARGGARPADALRRPARALRVAAAGRAARRLARPLDALRSARARRRAARDALPVRADLAGLALAREAARVGDRRADPRAGAARHARVAGR